MKTIILLLICVLLGLQYKLWVGNESFQQWLHLEKKLSTQLSENKKLNARNTHLEADIAELKSGEQALEEQARFELGMVKEGEVYYQFAE